MFEKFRKKRELKAKILAESVNFDALFGDINNKAQSEALFKGLSASCHPDRFVGDETKQAKAMELFKKVQTARYNFATLSELKSIIESELN